MEILFTKWMAYDGRVGITNDGEYYDLENNKKLVREVHCGAIYYRAIASKKRYSWNKCNKTKQLKSVEIIKLPF